VPVDEDLLGLEINHAALGHPILVPIRAAGNLTADQVFSLIERVSQSKNALAFDQYITIRAVIVHNPTGGALKRRTDVANIDEWLESHCGKAGSLIRVCFCFIDFTAIVIIDFFCRLSTTTSSASCGRSSQPKRTLTMIHRKKLSGAVTVITTLSRRDA